MHIELDGRNAIDDHVHVVSRLELNHVAFEQNADVSIAIPTFRRPDILLEAVASALAQNCAERCEIVIVDNDGEGEIDEHLKIMIAGQQKMNVRYYRNEVNIGMFGNWNRAITLSQGNWMTLLNDDDLLAPSFVLRSLAALNDVGGGEGIVCCSDTYDRRPGAKPSDASQAVSVPSRLRTYLRFNRYGVSRLTPRVLFFGNEAGNSAGFLFCREVAIQIGGFLPEEWPASDYTFYVRFAMQARLFLFSPILAHVGIGENESMRPETLTGFVEVLAATRLALAGREVPTEWKGLNSQLVSNSILDIKEAWGVELSRSEISRKLQIDIPKPNRKRVLLSRILLRGY